MPLPLPLQCEGCPFASKSKYFTPDKLTDSNVLILAQNPGNYEEQGLYLERYIYSQGREDVVSNTTPQPLLGPSGKMIREQFWPLAKLGEFDRVSKANVIKCRPNGVNDLPPIHSKELKAAINHCMHYHFHLPESVRYVLTLGQVALYGLTENKVFVEKSEDIEGKNVNSFFNWRGYTLGVNKESGVITGLKEYYSPLSSPNLINVMPTIHPAALFKDERMFHAVKNDFAKFGKLVRGEWPSVLPQIKRSFDKPLPKVLGFDTEYDIHDNNRLTLYSVATTEGDIYVLDPDIKLPLYDDTIIIGQNLLVDIAHFYNLVSSFPSYSFDDLMIAHSVLWPSEPHSLNYICSVYGRYNRHKHLIGEDFHFYAGLDADTTLNCGWRGVLKDFKDDPFSWRVYVDYRRPLIPILFEAEKRGIKINQERVELIEAILRENITGYKLEAELLTQREDFNLGSAKMVGNYLFHIEEIPKPVKVKKPRKKKNANNSEG